MEVEQRLAEIQLATGPINNMKVEVCRELLSLSPPLAKMLTAGAGIQLFQQITSIDTTIYYSPKIFQATGISDNSNLLAATVAVVVTKTVFILIAE